MPCTQIGNGIVCWSPTYRLRLEDGRYVFMDWHKWCGPTFYRDRDLYREIEEWWNDTAICKALEWFQKRGEKA